RRGGGGPIWLLHGRGRGLFQGVRSKRPLPRDWSDEELVRRMLAREPRAWRRFEERYRNLMYSSIIRVLNRVTAGVTSADVDEVYADLITILLRDDMQKLRVWTPSRGAGLG